MGMKVQSNHTRKQEQHKPYWLEQDLESMRDLEKTIPPRYPCHFQFFADHKQHPRPLYIESFHSCELAHMEELPLLHSNRFVEYVHLHPHQEDDHLHRHQEDEHLHHHHHRGERHLDLLRTVVSLNFKNLENSPDQSLHHHEIRHINYSKHHPIFFVHLPLHVDQEESITILLRNIVAWAINKDKQ